MTDETPYVAGEQPELEAPVATPVPGLGWKDFLKAIAIIWAVDLLLNILAAAIMLAASGFQPHAMKLRVEYLIPSLTLSWTSALGVTWYFLCLKNHRSIREAFALRAISWRTVRLCLAVGTGAAVTAGVLMTLFANGKGYIVDLATQPSPEGGGDLVIAPAFVVVLLLVPPIEELYYRGFLYPSLRRLAGTPVAFAVVVIWFGVVHAPQLFGDWAGVLVVTFMGGVFTYLRHRYDSILPSMLAHFTYNGALALAGIVASAAR